LFPLRNLDLNCSIFHLKLNKVKHIFIYTVLLNYICSFPNYLYLLFFRFVVDSSSWSELVSLNCSSGWIMSACVLKHDTLWHVLLVIEHFNPCFLQQQTDPQFFKYAREISSKILFGANLSFECISCNPYFVSFHPQSFALILRPYNICTWWYVWNKFCFKASCVGGILVKLNFVLDAFWINEK